MVNQTQLAQALRMLQATGVQRTRDFVAAGVARETLSRMVQSGIIERIDRGLYRLAEAEVSEYQTLVEVASRIPQGVICLLSALRFHELTTENPFEVWLAIEAKMRPPRVAALPIHFVRFSEPAFTRGIEEHRIGGVTMRVYSIAKTIADCFKFRKQIGLDVALAALHQAWHTDRITMDELWRCAQVDRVTNVMRPYLEALGAWQ